MNSIPATSNLFPSQAASSGLRSSPPVAEGQKPGDTNVKPGGKKAFAETAPASASEKEFSGAAAETPELFAALTPLQPIAEAPVGSSVDAAGEGGDF